VVGVGLPNSLASPGTNPLLCLAVYRMRHISATRRDGGIHVAMWDDVQEAEIAEKRMKDEFMCCIMLAFFICSIIWYILPAIVLFLAFYIIWIAFRDQYKTRRE
jgi:hypothetical protein